MSLGKLLRRAVLAEFGLVGRALADRLDGSDSRDDAPASLRGNREVARTSPDVSDRVEYQVLVNNQYWQTVYQGFGGSDPLGRLVAVSLNDLKRQRPGQPIRAVNVNGRLLDIRT